MIVLLLYSYPQPSHFSLAGYWAPQFGQAKSLFANIMLTLSAFFHVFPFYFIFNLSRTGAFNYFVLFDLHPERYNIYCY